MDQRFVNYYERELRYIRELGAEFARRYPKVAGRLGLGELSSDDPHVERLLQGFAFSAGGVQMALDAEFPGFTQPLAELLYRNYLAPTPSMAVVQFGVSTQSSALGEGFTVPRGTSLATRASAWGGKTCEFRTGHAVQLLPVSLESVSYTSVLNDIADLRVPTLEPIQALLKLTLRSHNLAFERLRIDALPLFIRGRDELSGRLYEQLLTSASPLVLRWGARPSDAAIVAEARPVRALGFDREHALLPCVEPVFEGHRLLQEYFACPARFDFVELGGLAQAVARCKSQTLDVIVPLRRFDPQLEHVIDARRFALFATPVVNLFPRDCGRIAAPRPGDEARITPDIARPLDFEVHSLTQVTGYTNAGDGIALPVTPRHAAHLKDEISALPSYTTRRRVTLFPERAAGARTLYAGSDLYLSLALPSENRSSHPLRQLGIHALCTNRDLPLSLTLKRIEPHRMNVSDFDVRSGVPADAVSCIVTPSAPHSGATEGSEVWRFLSHLQSNYLSLHEQTGGVLAVRELLGLYAQLGDPSQRRQAEGVRALRSKPIIGVLPGGGPNAFARGLEVEIECEEHVMSGYGAFTLASVLAQIFARHTSVNSFAQTVLTTRERGEVHRWQAIPGLRQVF